MQPTLCLKCGDFPCTCGEQYKNLEEYQYNELLKNLAKLKDDVTIYRHGQDIVSIVNNIPKEKTALFEIGSLEVASMPKDWKVFLQANEKVCARTLIDKLTKWNIDEFTFPSGLILAIMLKCNFSENVYARLLKDWMRGCNDDVTLMIRSLIDEKAAYLKTSIDNIDSFLLGFNSVPAQSLGTIDKMRINAAIVFKNLLLDIQAYRASAASMNLMLFMSTIVSYTEKQNIITYTSDWCDHELDNAVIYIDESFRNFVDKDKTEMNFPLLTAY